ncbi:MAG: glycoside hydrolase family 88 protein [Prevotella sp.]|jgi:rhamnogalacturonyl hydrolase YesR|nr:glycoside hydrolase family 88 protein [Prevotella sp.]
MKWCAILCLAFTGVFSSCLAGNDLPKPTAGDVESVLQKVSDWQIQNFSYSTDGNLHDYGIDAWTNAVLYIGMSEWAKIKNNDAIYKWLSETGAKSRWQIPANFKDYPKYRLYHADELCIAQFYLNMYDVYKDGEMIESTRERIDWILDNPSDKNMNYKNKQAWTWCDALFMAPPVYLRMGQIKKDSTYIIYMDHEYKNTCNHLYDKEEHLFFRDDSYFSKKEQNGKKVFWGRGNGWVAAGLVNILKALPENSGYRPFYENLFKDLVHRLAGLQSEDGFWRASLLDPDSYPSPESSATALITYALAYGINSGLLDGEFYQPFTAKAWDALTSAVDEDGKPGWVQPIGADPKKVTKDMTAVYGVGAFLLAGSEMYKLAAR